MLVGFRRFFFLFVKCCSCGAALFVSTTALCGTWCASSVILSVCVVDRWLDLKIRCSKDFS